MNRTRVSSIQSNTAGDSRVRNMLIGAGIGAAGLAALTGGGIGIVGGAFAIGLSGLDVAVLGAAAGAVAGNAVTPKDAEPSTEVEAKPIDIAAFVNENARKRAAGESTDTDPMF